MHFAKIGMAAIFAIILAVYNPVSASDICAARTACPVQIATYFPRPSIPNSTVLPIHTSAAAVAIVWSMLEIAPAIVGAIQDDQCLKIASNSGIWFASEFRVTSFENPNLRR
jgi:hypothetical protein